MLRNLVSLRARQAAQRVKKSVEESLEALSEALSNNATNHGPGSTPKRAPIPIPVRARQSSSPFQRIAYSARPGINHNGIIVTNNFVRQYSTNPFNPFSQYNSLWRFSRSFIYNSFRFSPFNPFNPLNRYKAFRQFRLVKSLFRTSSRSHFNVLRSQSLMANSIWNFSAFRYHHHHLHNLHYKRTIIQSKAFFLSGLYKAAFPKTSVRLFTTYASGGPIPGFSIQITSETIKNLAISFRTLFNLDYAYKPQASDNSNLYKPSKSNSPSCTRKKGSRHVRSDIRLNQSLSAKYTAKTLAIGSEVEEDTTTMTGVSSDEVDEISINSQNSIIHGCYVDFPLGGDLSIPTMTFLTEEILGEINANLAYITRRINELKQDFKNLSELGELPIKYLSKENVLRVYFPNCDRDKLEVLLREKNIVGGTIYENIKGPITSTPVVEVPIGTPTTATLNVSNVNASGNMVVNAAAAAAAAAVVRPSSSYITENDLLSSLYHSGNGGGSSSQSSDGSSALFEDDVLSSYGSSSNYRHHPLSDAEVIRISEFDSEVNNNPMGPIAISDSSGEYHWVARQ